LDADGHDVNFTADCTVKGTVKYDISVRGMSRRLEESFKLVCDDPDLKLTPHTFYRDKEEAIVLTGKVSRTCKLYKWSDNRPVKIDEKPLLGDIKAFRLAAYTPEGGECGSSETIQPSEGDADGVLTASLPRNHRCTRYEFRGRDGNNKLLKGEKKLSYPAVFKLRTSIEGFLNQDQQQDQPTVIDRRCIKAPAKILGFIPAAGCAEYRTYYSWKFYLHADFELSHIKYIKTTCWASEGFEEKERISGGSIFDDNYFSDCHHDMSCGHSASSTYNENTQNAVHTIPDLYEPQSRDFVAVAQADEQTNRAWNSQCGFEAFDYDGQAVPLTNENGVALTASHHGNYNGGQSDYGLISTNESHQYIFQWLNTVP
jgi:hypothetical protein